MNMLTIGNSHLAVTPQGLGCMGMSEFYGQSNDQHSKQLLQYAVSAGVNFFDTADIYGYGRNEILLGEFIATLPDRTHVVIATKCGIIRDEHDLQKRGIDNSREYIFACCEASIARLNTTIDLYYLHRVIDNPDAIFVAMSAMASLLKAGKIKAVGLSEANAEYIRYAHQCLLDITEGKHGISAVQSEYSLLSRGVENDGVLAACRELGITFIAYSPISRGLLSGELNTLDKLDHDDFRRTLPRFSDENLSHNNKLTTALTELAQAKSCTPAQLALAWLMHQSPAVIPIPGTKQQKYLQQNINAMIVTLNADEMNLLDSLSGNFKVQGTRYTEQAMRSYALTE